MEVIYMNQEEQKEPTESEKDELSILRIFPTTRKEFKTVDEFACWLLTSLKARDGIYHLRSSRGEVKKTPPGSVVSFRFGNELIGEAIVKCGFVEEKVEIAGVTYEGHIQFEESSLRIYKGFFPIPLFQKILEKRMNPKDIPDLSYAGAYNRFEDWNIYIDLLKKQVERRGFLY